MSPAARPPPEPSAGLPVAERLRPHLAVLRARMLELLQYRAAAAAGVATQLAFGLLHVQVLAAFYAGAREAPPLPLAEAATYVWLGQALFAMLPWRQDPRMHRAFTRGEVLYELLRPVDLYSHWYAQQVAFLLAPAALRAPPLALLACLVADPGPPASPAAALAFLLALAGSLALGAAMVTTLTITQLWTVSGQGSSSLHGAAFFLFSGMLVPLPLFPDWVQPLLRLLPYAGVTDAPFRLWLGQVPASRLPAVLLHQLAWTALLVLAGRALLDRARRHLVVQGG